MRWRAGYAPANDDVPEIAGVEAATAVDAVSRLRDVVGTYTDVLYVVPAAPLAVASDVTYETFLTGPDVDEPLA